MRIALVLAAVIALVVLLFIVLRDEPRTAGIGLAPDAKAVVAPRTDDAREGSDLAAPARTSGEPVDPTSLARAAASPATSVALVVAVLAADGTPLRESVAVECRDALARPVPLIEGPDAVWRSDAIAPGGCTLSATANSFLPAIETVAVRADLAEQRVEIRLKPAPRVRVRWQTEDGAPFLPALRRPGVLAHVVLASVALDDSERGVGVSAPNARNRSIHGIDPKAEQTANLPSPWPGAPDDAVCELALGREPPTWLTASLDGTVVASARVEDVTQDIVLRTPLEIARRLRATVRFCLVDARTGERVSTASISGTTQSGIGRTAAEIGPEGCRVDTRFGAGSWLLMFQAPGRTTLFRAVDLVSGADLDLGELRFEEPAQVVVRVTNADGSPAAGVRLALFPRDRFEWGEMLDLSTDPDGTARFTDLSLGTHVLVVADARFAARARIVEPRAGDRHSAVPLQLESGVEIALDFGPQTSISARAFLYDAGGNPVAAPSAPTSGLVPLRLMPGEYVVELEGASSAHAFTVTNESTVFDVR